MSIFRQRDSLNWLSFFSISEKAKKQRFSTVPIFGVPEIGFFCWFSTNKMRGKALFFGRLLYLLFSRGGL